MTELKATFNHRISHDMNVSITVTNFVVTEDDAGEAGRSSARIVSAFIDAYAQETKTIGEETS